MSRTLTRKQKVLLENMGYSTTKVERRNKRDRDQRLKRRRKRY